MHGRNVGTPSGVILTLLYIMEYTLEKNFISECGQAFRCSSSLESTSENTANSMAIRNTRGHIMSENAC